MGEQQAGEEDHMQNKRLSLPTALHAFDTKESGDTSASFHTKVFLVMYSASCIFSTVLLFGEKSGEAKTAERNKNYKPYSHFSSIAEVLILAYIGRQLQQAHLIKPSGVLINMYLWKRKVENVLLGSNLI